MVPVSESTGVLKEDEETPATSLSVLAHRGKPM